MLDDPGWLTGELVARVQQRGQAIMQVRAPGDQGEGGAVAVVVWAAAVVT